MREGQSLLEVKAAGINFADVLIKNGMYPQPPELPTVLGNEVAGDIGDRRVVAFVRHSRRRLRGARRGRRRVGVRPAGGRELRRGRRVPDHVPDRLDPDDAAGAHPPRHERARDGRGGRGRHGGDPGGGVLRRHDHRGRRLGGEARAGAQARRPAGRRLRGDRRARRHRRRLRPGRRPRLHGVHQGAAPARRRDRDRLRRRHLGAGRPGAARRPQRRRPGLLPRPADGLPPRPRPARGRASCSRSGGAARSTPSSAPSTRSSRRTRRST